MFYLVRCSLVCDWCLSLCDMICNPVGIVSSLWFLGGKVCWESSLHNQLFASCKGIRKGQKRRQFLLLSLPTPCAIVTPYSFPLSSNGRTEKIYLKRYRRLYHPTVWWSWAKSVPCSSHPGAGTRNLHCTTLVPSSCFAFTVAAVG